MIIETEEFMPEIIVVVIRGRALVFANKTSQCIE